MSYILYDGDDRQEIIFSQFPDGDTHCTISDMQHIDGKAVLVVHDLYPDQDSKIIQLTLLLDLLQDAGARTVSVFVPYLSYARQDKRHVPGEALSSVTICRLLHRMGCARLYTIDCHFLKGRKTAVVGGLTIYNTSAIPLLVTACRERIGHNAFDVVGPDSGSRHMTKQYGAKTMHKARGAYQMVANRRLRPVVGLTGAHIALEYTTAVIVDDIISTGSTLSKAATALRQRGATTIFLAATHGLFLGEAATTLTQLTQGIIVSDTVATIYSIAVIQTLLDDVILPHWQRSQQ